jgi:hypothetical protein
LTRAVFDQYFNAAVDEKKNVNASSVLAQVRQLAPNFDNFESFSGLNST